MKVYPCRYIFTYVGTYMSDTLRIPGGTYMCMCVRVCVCVCVCIAQNFGSI